MVLRYITPEEFLNGQSGVKVEIGDDKCFKTIDDLIFFLTAIEEMVDNYLGRKLNRDTYIDRFWGNGSSMRNFKNYPCESVISLTYFCIGMDAPETIESDQYFVTRTLIQYPGKFSRNLYYELTYIAGWEIQDIPTVIKQAIIEQAGLTLQEHMRGVLHSESGGNSKLIYEVTPLPLWSQIEQKLRPYKRPNYYL